MSERNNFLRGVEEGRTSVRRGVCRVSALQRTWLPLVSSGLRGNALLLNFNSTQTSGAGMTLQPKSLVLCLRDYWLIMKVVFLHTTLNWEKTFSFYYSETAK